MLKSWLVLLASDTGNGTPSSGSPAQQAVWPEEAVTLRRNRPQAEEEDKVMKMWGTTGREKMPLRPESGTWLYRGGRNGVCGDDKPAFQSADDFGAERVEPCLT